MAVRFRRRIFLQARVRWVEVPRRTVERLGLVAAQHRGWYAVLRFGDEVDRVTLLPGRPGCLKVALKVELLRAAGLDAGDELPFTLAPDRAPREPDLPEEMRRAFQAQPALSQRWQAHSIAQRRQVVAYIEAARQPETRARRAWIFLDRLAATGSLGAGAGA